MATEAASREREAAPDKARLSDRHYTMLALVLVAAAFAYSNSFGTPFQFDDELVVTLNPRIRDISNIPHILIGMNGPWASRPLMLSTFALNYYAGGMETWGYHAVNFAIHLVNVILLFFVVRTAGRRLGYQGDDVRAAAAMSAALFALHPAQTEAVTYIASRSMLFATSFFFLGLLLYDKAVDSERKRGFYIAGLFAASLLGMGSREDFATFPAVVLLYDAIFISKFNMRETLRHYRAYVPVFASLGYMALIILGNTYVTSAESHGAGMSPADYLLTEFRVQWTYLRLLALPVNQNADHDYPVSNSILELGTLVSVLGYLGLWGFAVLSAKRRPVASFPLLWFLVTLLPVSFAVTFLDLSLGDVIFEHRLYLPGAGVLVLASAMMLVAAKRLKARWPRAGGKFLAMFLVLVLALACGTYARNRVWKSEVSFWEDVVWKSPRKARSHNNLGQAYADVGFKSKAVEQYQSAIRLGPEIVEAQINLGNAYMEAGRPELAAERYEAAVSTMPGYSTAHMNLGNAYMELGRYGEAIEHFKKAIEITPYLPDWYNNLAYAYYLNGQSEKADEYFKKSIEMRKAGR